MSDCPCGSGLELDACCGPYVRGEQPAPTAVALMRSRFTAYARGDTAYLQSTLCKAERGEGELSASEIKEATWQHLEIRATEAGLESDDSGIVEFIAHYKSGGEQHAHHERSTFCREDGRWVYESGVIAPKGQPVTSTKVGRNDPCPCGSGKKYKKCCGK